MKMVSRVKGGGWQSMSREGTWDKGEVIKEANENLQTKRKGGFYDRWGLGQKKGGVS